MSKIKVGDRVRFVVEVDVLDIDDDGFMYIAGDGWRDYAEIGVAGVVSIEVIPAPFVLPTKRWAQVLDMNGLLWTRVWTDEDYGYGWASTSGHQITNEQLLGASRLRVISEGVDDD